MAKAPTPKFPNFREAFCAYYRCRPEDYQRRAFMRAMNPFKMVLGLPIYTFNKPFFAMDFGVVDSIGDARTESEFGFAMDELIGINRVERSIRRGLLGIRISGSRLKAMWETLKPYIEAPAAEAPRVDAAVVPQDIIGRRAPEAGPAGAALAPQLVRRLRSASDAVISGVPVAQAVAEAGFESEADFVAALRSRADVHGQSRWLLAQLELAGKLAALESELAHARSVIADQQVELSRLRPPGGKSTPGNA